MDLRIVPSRERHARFEQLAGEVLDPLERYLRRRAAPDDAVEVLNDTLLVLWRRLDDVPNDATLPWCYAVARRCLANHRRAAGRRVALLERIRDRSDRSDADRQGVRGSPDIEPLGEALARLPAAELEVIRLWAWEQLEPREIATVLGVSANAVSIRLHRARKRIAAMLEADGVLGARSGPAEREADPPDTERVSAVGRTRGRSDA
jgi:RNA polymerase sigma-70 factor, ECF subfamily